MRLGNASIANRDWDLGLRFEDWMVWDGLDGLGPQSLRSFYVCSI